MTSARHDEPVLDAIVAHEGAAFAREFQLQIGDVAALVFDLIAFRGREAMGELYHFEVVASVDSHVAEKLVIGSPARLTIPNRDGTRSVHGVVDEILRAATDSHREVVRVGIVPRAFALTKRSNTRVFQNLTAPAIVAAVLKEHGVELEQRLSKFHDQRIYSTQYAETDYAFVARLCAEEGLAFWFEHPPVPVDTPTASPTERLVLADSTLAYSRDCVMLNFRPGLEAMTTPDSADVTVMRRVSRQEQTAAAVRRYDFERAASNAGRALPVQPNAHPAHQGGVVSQAFAGEEPRPGPLALEWYEPHEHEHGLRIDNDVVDRKLEQLRTLSDTVSIVTAERGLTPGQLFAVLDQEVIGGQKLVALEVVHRGSHRPGDKIKYQARVIGAPSSVLGRAPVPPRRMVQVVESGVVVGTVGQEIETDAHGRVKVQLLWDRLGKNDEHSSCWVRVMQPWSGAQHGFQFVPRIGTEVLVSFLGGDPDRPVIVGCLPNPANSLPFAIPDQLTKSGIRTQSTPAGAGRYNELSFDDRNGDELVFLRAQKHHEVVVNENQTERIGGQQLTSVAGGRTIEVTGADVLNVTGARALLVTGELAEVVTLGRHEVIGREHKSEVGGDEELAVDGKVSMHAGHEVRIEAGTKEKSNAVLMASNETRLVGHEAVRVYSPTAIELKSGDSVITINPEGVTVKAKKVTLIATETLQLTREKTTITLDDKIEAVSQEIDLQTAQASLLLTATAELHGTRVLLGGVKGKTAVAAPKEDAKKKKATFHIRRPKGYDGPMTAVISLPTGEVVDKAVGASGEVELEGYDGEEFHLLEVRMGDEKVSHGSLES